MEALPWVWVATLVIAALGWFRPRRSPVAGSAGPLVFAVDYADEPVDDAEWSALSTALESIELGDAVFSLRRLRDLTLVFVEHAAAEDAEAVRNELVLLTPRFPDREPGEYVDADDLGRRVRWFERPLSLLPADWEGVLFLAREARHQDRRERVSLPAAFTPPVPPQPDPPTLYGGLTFAQVEAQLGLLSNKLHPRSLTRDGGTPGNVRQPNDPQETGVWDLFVDRPTQPVQIAFDDSLGLWAASGHARRDFGSSPFALLDAIVGFYPPPTPETCTDIWHDGTAQDTLMPECPACGAQREGDGE